MLYYTELRADCKNCSGLCCVSLYFSASEGFPTDKNAGIPCVNLQPDFRCGVHQKLSELGLKGCQAFDCFGAGQKVSQVTFGGQDWRKLPVSATQMFEVFLITLQLHELLWYLNEALTLQPTDNLKIEIKVMLHKLEQLSGESPEVLMNLELPLYRAEVNNLLLETSKLVRARVKAEIRRGNKQLAKPDAQKQKLKNIGRRPDLAAADLREIDLRGANLRGSCLIAADLRGNDFSGTDFIGADFRDADLRGADLSRSIFLSQAQVSAAKGDVNTKLPAILTRPVHWLTR